MISLCQGQSDGDVAGDFGPVRHGEGRGLRGAVLPIRQTLGGTAEPLGLARNRDGNHSELMGETRKNHRENWKTGFLREKQRKDHRKHPGKTSGVNFTREIDDTDDKLLDLEGNLLLDTQFSTSTEVS